MRVILLLLSWSALVLVSGRFATAFAGDAVTMALPPQTDLARLADLTAEFAGVSLQMGPDTSVQLPGTAWGNDDKTIERFKADTKKGVPGTGDARYRDRAKFLGDLERKTWLAWRAEQLAKFYADIQNDVARSRPNAKLYLATGAAG